jgi:hypothetical protein
MQVFTYTGVGEINEEVEVSNFQEALSLPPFGTFLVYDRDEDDKGYVFRRGHKREEIVLQSIVGNTVEAEETLSYNEGESFFLYLTR